MSWLLLWILTAAGIQQVGTKASPASSHNLTAVPAVASAAPDAHSRTQYCKWPCVCPDAPPTCPPGVSLLVDGCDCCKTCARQVGEGCDEAATCDHHRGLYCDYSADKPRYEKGVCAYMAGSGCEHDGVIYRNGQSFAPSCKYQCVCVNGAIGCVGLCAESQPPPRVWCQAPRRVKVPGQCCERWICDEARRGRKTAPRHAIEAAPAETRSWHRNCIPQTSSWSPCSRSCGRGLSLRVSNANERCELVKESRLCNLRPCEVNITGYIKPGKKCLNIYREELPSNLTISGCTSKRPYRPKYCGVCTDERCCIPYKSRTVEVEFQCPNGTGFSWKMLWIQACFCNLSCRNPNDIFTELDSYYGYSEIVN
uniref:Cellular communication network factor 4a n=1 Tax=Tetraodon nigroviridis TaxID=99883 RepID=H3CLR8_TETNG